jgi:hypothetical protein
MKKFLFLFLAVPLFLAPLLHATSYPPPTPEPICPEEDVMRAGAKLHLFHSGTEEVKRAIKINNVLTVYREDFPEIPGSAKETGKVRVLATLGEYYFVGEMIEGFAEPGYLAVKGTVRCLITTRLKQKH